jgi:RNA polymerase sigma factor (sigma-70 family)
VRRQRRDFRRTRSLEAFEDDVPDEADWPESTLLRMEEREFVRGLIDRLSAAQQTAIRARYIEERPVAEVAARLLRSEAAAQGVLKRALAQLRDLAQLQPMTPAGPPNELGPVERGPNGDT